MLVNSTGSLGLVGLWGASGFIFSQLCKDEQTQKSLFSTNKILKKTCQSQTFTNSSCEVHYAGSSSHKCVKMNTPKSHFFPLTNYLLKLVKTKHLLILLVPFVLIKLKNAIHVTVKLIQCSMKATLSLLQLQAESTILMWGRTCLVPVQI